MPYNPQTWHDSPATDTPITAAALTHIEQGIAGVDSGLTAEIARAQAAEAALGSQVPTHPWQFAPETYGAKGDGRVIGDAVVTSGSTTLTSATAGFTSADTGKHIMINGAQGAATPLCTTITYVNATTVTLGTASPQSLSAANAIYGTDDTAAFQSMMTAMKIYAEANSFFAEAVLAPKSYCLAGVPLQTSSPAVQNAQIPVPYPTDLTGKGRKLVISITGSGSSSNSQYWLGTVPNMQGTSLVSMVVAPANVDATYGVQSVIGGPCGGGALGGSFANTKVSVRNVTVWTGATTQQFAYDFRYLGGAEVRDSSAQAFASVAGSQPNLPSLPGNSFFQSRTSVGLAMPVSGNNADCYVDNFSVEGFVSGLQVSDTFTAGKVESTYTCFGLLVDLTTGLSNHLSRISIQNYCCGESLAAIHVSGNGTVPVSINMSTELITTAHIQDAGNALYGRIGWADTDISTPTITGAANLNFVNETVAPTAYATKAQISAVQWVPAPSGDTTGTADTAAIQAAISAASAAGGGTVRLAPGAYWVTGLTQPAYVFLEGAGVGTTILNLANGANSDVIAGASFSSLSMSGNAAWGNQGANNSGIRDLTIDGNAANQSGQHYGIRVYGCQLVWEDVDVRNCSGSGIWTEWGPLQVQATKTTSGSESTMRNVKSHHHQVHGWLFLGPSDARMESCIVFFNSQGGPGGIGFWAMWDGVSNVMSTASAMNGVNASGFTGTFTVNAAQTGGATDLYPASGRVTVTTSSGTAVMTYTGKTATTLTGCAVTSGSGTFVTGNAVVNNPALGQPLWTTNGLQMVNCHVFGNNHTWSAVFDSSGDAATGCHFEGAQYGQVLIRGSVDIAGGYVYDQSFATTGCGIQMGDDGTTPGIPLSSSQSGYARIVTRLAGFVEDIPSRASLVFKNISQHPYDIDVFVACNAQNLTATVTSGTNGSSSDLSTWTSGSPGTITVPSTNGIPPGAGGTLTVPTATGSVTCTYTSTGGSAGPIRGSGTHIDGVVPVIAPAAGSTITAGGTVSLQNAGTVPVTGTQDISGTSRLRVASTGKSQSTNNAASQMVEGGSKYWDVGSGSKQVQIFGNGTQLEVLNTAVTPAQRQYPNGTSLYGYSDSFSTRTWVVNGAKGHIGFGNSGTAVSFSAGVNAGTSAPAPVSGSGSCDTAGSLTFGTGTSPAAGQQVSVSFGNTYTTAPVVVMCPANSATAALQPYVSGVTAGGFSVNFAVTPSASQGNTVYAVDYVVIARST